MSDIVNAFKQTKGYKKRKNLLSDTKEVAQQPQEQESQNQALNASQQQNIALDTSGTKDSDRLAQLQQLAAAETAHNSLDKSSEQSYTNSVIIWACSSVGMSVRFASERSRVRLPPGP